MGMPQELVVQYNRATVEIFSCPRLHVYYIQAPSPIATSLMRPQFMMIGYVQKRKTIVQSFYTCAPPPKKKKKKKK